MKRNSTKRNSAMNLLSVSFALLRHTLPVFKHPGFLGSILLET